MKNKNVIRAISLLLVAIMIIFGAISVVQAKEFSPDDLPGIGGRTVGNGNSVVPDVPDVSNTQKAINTVTNIVLFGVCIPLAALSIGFFGISFFLGDKKAEDAKNRAKYCLIALAVLLLVSGAINVGRNLAYGITWDPSLNTNRQIIAPQNPEVDFSIDTEGSAESSADDGGEF